MTLPAFTLRPETAEDEPFLRRLYVAIRWAEVEAMGIPDEARRPFLEQQFSMQRSHYQTHYHDAEFSVIEADGAPVGRLYLFRGTRDHRIVDISLLPETSGQGIGGTLLDRVMAEAAALGRGVSIHVEGFNPARRLYDRKGFREIERRGPYWLMEWFPDGATPSGQEVQLNTAS
ncbi:GNAT family N-acetyltransferase [Sphingomonas alpina]|uniref:GNAT family N-acetyltransferase n=1 Tax=Sphingomonas alpina TaxID=653931 RepID=A0A7H0LKH6_9SPHN|nr:GNAT family N-acetyltransferase [Sphingomonas alpina]QNQ10179.1 GNAT family N-acetyltransferase [Sphingomonas alpina]